MSAMPDLPTELIDEIARHVAQQSGLDLLALSRTSLSLRKAARRVGRAALQKYAIFPDQTGTFPSRESSKTSPMLQSCMQPLPELDFPVAKWPSDRPCGLTDEDANKRSIIPHRFCGRDQSDRNSWYELDCELFIRNIRHRSIELWDVHDYPPKVVKLQFAKSVPRAPSVYSCRRYDAAWHAKSDPRPGVHVQVISMDDIRVVLARTLAEQTFHLIDAHGQPYLSWTLKSSSSTDSTPRCLTQRPSECIGLCGSSEWVNFQSPGWHAVPLPRRRQDDPLPGIFFYHIHSNTLMDWSLLLARPDWRSSETVSAGTLDLGSLTSAEAPRRIATHFSVDVVAPTDDGGFIAQISWRVEQQALPKGRDHPHDVRLVHCRLQLIQNGFRSAQDALPRLASASIATSLPLWPALSEQDYVRLSKDGLQLYVLLPSLDDRGISMLSIFQRATIDETWRADATVQIQTGSHSRILGSYDQWLVIIDKRARSMQVLRVGWPVSHKLHTFHLWSQGPRVKKKSLKTDEQDKKDDVSIFLRAGRVVLTSGNGIVRGIVELNTDDEPYMVDLDQLVGRCCDTRNCNDGDRPMPKQCSECSHVRHGAGSGTSSPAKIVCREAGSCEPQHLRFWSNHYERPNTHAEAQHTEALVLFVRSTAEAQEDIDTEGTEVTMWTYHAILLQPRRREIKIEIAGRNRGDEDADPLMDLFIFKAIAYGQLWVDFFNDEDDLWDDWPFARKFVDSTPSKFTPTRTRTLPSYLVGGPPSFERPHLSSMLCRQTSGANRLASSGSSAGTKWHNESLKSARAC